MKNKGVFDTINDSTGKRQFAILLDPDKLIFEEIQEKVEMIVNAGASYVFVGGSLIVNEAFEAKLSKIKKISVIPVVLFPGSPIQISKNVDAILFLSLISGRNPEFLIGNHVVSALRIKELGLETIATGYMLVDCGKQTAASYMSNTTPIPYDKSGIAAATALAGEMLGLKMTYLDGGSGAEKPISAEMIKAVKSQFTGPLIVGGGVNTIEAAEVAWNSGADIIVVGTAFENNPEFVFDLSLAISR